MFGSNAGKVCLFSAISGVITLDGKPASGALLKRTVDHQKPKSDETHTDANGHFEFPAFFEKTIAKYLPMEFVVGQKIMVTYQEKNYKIWSGVKSTPEENSEARGKALVVKCELNSEKKLVLIDGDPIFSRCTWDVDPDPEIDPEFYHRNY